MRHIAFILGILVIIISLVWLFLWRFLPIGINDAEWGHIRETGLPSGGGEGLVWSDWQTNDIHQITLFGYETNVAHDSTITAYRLGKGEDLSLSFGFYQAKCQTDDGQEVIVPAYGPDSWTRMKWGLPLGSLLFGVVLTGTGLYMKRKHQQRT
jgi:hypothetical protein